MIYLGKFNKGDKVITNDGVTGIVDHIVEFTITLPEGTTELGYTMGTHIIKTNGKLERLPLSNIKIAYWICREGKYSFPADESELTLLKD